MRRERDARENAAGTARPCVGSCRLTQVAQRREPCPAKRMSYTLCNGENSDLVLPSQRSQRARPAPAITQSTHAISAAYRAIAHALSSRGENIGVTGQMGR
jgi:hypothetical protein